MRRLLHRSSLLAASFLCSVSALMAQTQVQGKVVDENKVPLIGAVVTIPGTTKGIATDENGNFSLESSAAIKAVEVNFMGYEKFVQNVTNSSGELGVIEMKPSAVGLDEVVVIASIITSDRQTPIPISNVKFEEIESKISNLEFPELLKSTPSVYVTREGGGFGDSRINMRGFDSSNLGVLINGVPINGMENGKVYWSNWSSLSDVTQFMQVQRGIGASKLGISSVGGTMNMVTFGTQAKRGGSFFAGIGNDGYTKQSLSLSTGMLENGWAVSLAGSRTSGDGYIYGTNFEAWSYFGNISKVINDSHKLSLTAFGAPQWHNQRSTQHYFEDYKNSPEGGRLNNQYGYYNGEIVGGAYAHNNYHKPQVSLNHYWTIDSKTSLTTSAYASIASGGGRRTRGDNRYALTIDYTTGRPYETTYMTADGLLDIERAYNENAANANGSQVIFTDAINDHDWYGVLSSFRKEMNDKLTFTGGFDGRYYLGYHGEVITDLLGGDYYAEGESTIYGREANVPLQVGDKVTYSNTGEIIWAGLFGQLEYATDKFSAFASASLTSEYYRYHNEGVAPELYYDGEIIDANDTDHPNFDKASYTQVSDFVNFLPWSAKAGLNYKFDENNNAFLNFGYIKRAPNMNSVFVENTIDVNKGAIDETIITGEIGYGFSTDKWNIAANAYYTNWQDKFLRRKVTTSLYANIPNLDAIHYGVELEATFRPSDKLQIKAMGSWGDWTWADDVSFSIFDEETQEILGTFNAYVDGVHVGDAAQLTAAVNINWEFLENLHLSADYNFAGKNFAEFDPGNRISLEDAGIDSWQMPDYYTIDLGLRYKFKLAEGLSGTFYANVNNLTNVVYVADATDGSSHDALTAIGYYGFGTTWTTGLKIHF